MLSSYSFITLSMNLLQENFRVAMSPQYSNRYEYWNHVQIPPVLLQNISSKVHSSNKEFIISPFSMYALEQSLLVGVDIKDRVG